MRAAFLIMDCLQNIDKNSLGGKLNIQKRELCVKGILTKDNIELIIDKLIRTSENSIP